MRHNVNVSVWTVKIVFLICQTDNIILKYEILNKDIILVGIKGVIYGF